MAATDERYLAYKSLLEPSNEWAFNFILDTVSLRSKKVHDNYPELLSNYIHSSQRVVGSVAEGLCLRVGADENPNDADDPSQSDIDLMDIIPGVLIVTDIGGYRDHDKDSSHELLYSITTETRPGYLRIARVNPNDYEDLFRMYKSTDVYLPAQALNTSGDGVFRDFVSLRTHGPAIEFTTRTRTQYMLWDLVIALRCYPWPAKNWQSRKRPSGWPSRELLTKIVSDGCHVVNKAHPKTSGPDAEIEFRYSFSVAELELCRSLSDRQKRCMKLFKLIVLAASDQTLSKEYGLSSYHLKTVFFWLCEKVPEEIWAQDKTGQCLLALLDQLLEFLNEVNIPNYFIPENNMIDHLSVSDVQNITERIRRIRDNPVHHLFFSDRFLPSFVLFGVCSWELFKPVIDALPCQDTSTQCATRILVLQTAARSTVQFYEGYERALEISKVQSQLLESLGFQLSPHLLLTIIFMDRFKLLFLCPSWSNLLCNGDEVSNFLYATGHYEASIFLLEKAGTYLSEGLEGEDAIIFDREIRTELVKNYLQLRNFDKVDEIAKLSGMPIFDRNMLSVFCNILL